VLGLSRVFACALSVEQDAFAVLSEGECVHEKLDTAEERSNVGGVLHFLLVEHTKLLPLNLVCGVFCQQKHFLSFIPLVDISISFSIPVSAVDSWLI